MSDINNQPLIEELLAHLKKGKQLYESITEVLDKKYLIDGKSVGEWREYFNIKVPKGVGLDELGSINAQLNNAINEAGFFYAKATLVEQSLRTGADAKFDLAFNTLVEKYKTDTGKLPANATLEKLSQSDPDVKAAMSNASAHSKFWKSITEFLYDQRKVIEQQRWILYTDQQIGREQT